MKLLFDQNLSPRLVGGLADLYPEAAHVYPLGLGAATDAHVWAYARQHGYTIVSKDADFGEMSVLFGHPPKVVWLRLGNCSVHEVELVLRRDHNTLEAFGRDAQLGLLLLY